MNDKQLVALEAVKLVKDGMLVGLGTGSTANFFIDELARRYSEDGLRLSVVSSSIVSAMRAQSLGLPIVAMEHLPRIDLYVDGADEVTPDNTLLKGRGYDLVREKLLAKACDQFIVLVDQSKLVSHIGERYAIPVEVMPFAWQMVKHSLEQQGGRGELRQNTAKDGLAITSHGSLVLDMSFDYSDSAALDAMLNATPGVVEHGIFHDLASVVLVAADGKIEQRRTLQR